MNVIKNDLFKKKIIPPALTLLMLILPQYIRGEDNAGSIQYKKILPLVSPVRIDSGNRDLIYVSDYHRKRIVVFRVKNFRLNPKTEIRLDGFPLGVAVFNDKYIFVGNSTKNIVQVFRENGKYAYRFSVPAIKPNDIAISKEKKVYVVASDENLIKVYDFFGKFRFSFGGYGSGPGEFDFPSGIAVDEQNTELIVSDFLNKRIQVFDMEGNWLRSFGGGMFMSVIDRPQGITVDRNGNYHVVDSRQACVHVFDPQGNRMRSYGVYGKMTGQIRTPLDIVINNDGHSFVTSNLNRNIEIFAGEGK